MSDMRPSHAINRPICLILDFDGTLTRKDTMHLVAEAGYSHQEELKRNPQPRPWKEIVDAYMSDFEDHAKSYTPQPENRVSLRDELAWLDSLEEVESASITRALRAGIFDRVRSHDMQQAVEGAIHGGRLQLRDGWLSLLSAVQLHNSRILELQKSSHCAVLSVNWSREFIRQTLIRNADPRPGDSSENPWSHSMKIYANELPSIADQSANTNQGQVEPYRNIRTSGDKAALLRAFAEERKDALTIYVGDSSTDLGCLTVADIGICMRDEPPGSGQTDLARTCDRINVQVDHIGTSDASTVFANGSRPTLLWVNSFVEIQDWLFDSETHKQGSNANQ